MKLSVIVPCYNEEASLPLFFAQTEPIAQGIIAEVEYLFINDGSKDKTLEMIKKLEPKFENSKVRYLSFSRNFGKEAALLAGLEHATGDFITVMDADLQDPPEMLPEMLHLLQTEDYDCIGTKRMDRRGEPKIRSFFAQTFYRMINRISDTEMVDGVRDFRLMTRQMVDAILEVKEYNRFSKGIFSWVGFNTKYLPYENQERVAGETSWSFWSLFRYSLEAIINFSDFPLTLASFIGFFSCAFSAIALLFIVVRTLIIGDSTSGWPSLVCIILFVGGLQLFCLGIVGKYVGKIFLETKKRPVYIVKETEKS